MFHYWVPKPVFALKFAVKMVLHIEVSDLFCDIKQVIGLFIGGLINGGLTIGLYICGITLSGLTFSCEMIKYDQMCSHCIIFKVSLAIFQDYIRKD